VYGYFTLLLGSFLQNFFAVSFEILIAKGERARENFSRDSGLIGGRCRRPEPSCEKTPSSPNAWKTWEERKNSRTTQISPADGRGLHRTQFADSG
jgi:hypothetical protein